MNKIWSGALSCFRLTCLISCCSKVSGSIDFFFRTHCLFMAINFVEPFLRTHLLIITLPREPTISVGIITLGNRLHFSNGDSWSSRTKLLHAIEFDFFELLFDKVFALGGLQLIGICCVLVSSLCVSWRWLVSIIPVRFYLKLVDVILRLLGRHMFVTSWQWLAAEGFYFL